MSLQYEVGLSYDARCTFHPLCTSYNAKQRAEAFKDSEKISRKVNQKETIYRDSCELANCCLDALS